MTYRDWLPSLWTEENGDADNPFLALRNQVGLVFHDSDQRQQAAQRDSQYARTQARLTGA